MSDRKIYRNNDLVSFHIDPAAPEKAWDALRLRCPTLSKWGVKKLREGLNGFVRSVVLEPLYICKDHRNLHSNFYSKRFLEVTSNCSRLHFFSKPNVDPKDLLVNEEKFRDDYLGYSVVRPVKIACLGRTVIDPYLVGRGIKEGFYLLRTPFKSHINGTRFQVCGYPWTSQDGDATLCAHSALWGVCRYLSERYTHYGELRPFDFIRMTERSEGRAAPYRGLTYTDYCRILSEFGTFPIARKVEPSGSEATPAGLDPGAFQDLCTYVESGFPVLVSLRLPEGGHVVSFVGHTMDCTKSVDPAVEFVDSSHFLKQFVVVDDAAFPYRTLGYEDDPENYEWDNGEKASMGKIRTMTCPLPEKVFVPAEEARKRAMRQCDNFLSKLKLTGSAPFVTRLFVTNSSAFKTRKLMLAKTGPDLASSVIPSLHFPHFIWVMELSPLDLYRKGFCTAEIVLDATSGGSEDGLIYARIGDQIHLARERAIFWNTVKGAPGYFAQYTRNLGERNTAGSVPDSTKA